MSGLLLAALLIIIPAVGTLLGIFFGRLEDAVAAEGKTRDWLIFILIFLPSIIVSFILFKYLHVPATYSVSWLPGIVIGLRINEVSIVLACAIICLSALLALYSISYMSYDRNRTRYWFFFQLTVSAMMMIIFSNNLFWMFGGIEVAAIGAFFLISHWYKKSGEEGDKAGKAAIRYLIMSVIGDIFLLIGFSFILVAFKTPVISNIINVWSQQPIRIIGDSSRTTRLLIKLFIAIGALIKSAQIPFLLWPIGGQKSDYDISKAPLPISSSLISVTVGNIGLFLLCTFYPLFSRKGLEEGTNIELYHSAPFMLIGWIAILSLVVVVGFILVAKNINRVTIGAGIAQLSLALLSFSSNTTIGLVGTIFQIIAGAPTVIALALVFGSVIESLRIKDISRVNGIKDKHPLLHLFGVFSIASFAGIFPSSMYFSKDMIFEALRTSNIPTHWGLYILTIICSMFVIFAIMKVYMQIFYGEMVEDYSTRPLKSLSLISTGAALGWSMLSGLVLILIGYPKPFLFSGLLGRIFTLNYDSPFTANFISSPIILLTSISAFLAGYFIYRDGEGNILFKFKNSKFILPFKKFFVNGLYLDKIYELLIFRPIDYLGRFFSWTRIKAPFGSIIWAVLSVVLLICIFLIMGGSI
ncbi:MAG TPA: proton-conducting transporter membrane subunit [Candidatus Bathyarchaeia archaeon]|nr:proton-conducting transporter membrane subunit [Candidatus Bathyarchaeia archaeon]